MTDLSCFSTLRTSLIFSMVLLIFFLPMVPAFASDIAPEVKAPSDDSLPEFIPFEAFGGQELMDYPVTHFFIDHLEEFEILGDTLLGLPLGKNGYIDLRPVGGTYEFRENYERSIAKPGHGILLDNFFPDETSGRETLAALDFFFQNRDFDVDGKFIYIDSAVPYILYNVPFSTPQGTCVLNAYLFFTPEDARENAAEISGVYYDRWVISSYGLT